MTSGSAEWTGRIIALTGHRSRRARLRRERLEGLRADAELFARSLDRTCDLPGELRRKRAADALAREIDRLVDDIDEPT